MSSNIKVRRVVASVVAASALGAAAPALAVEVAAASAPRTLPACCEGAVPEARERVAETEAAPADARAARAARDVAQATEPARADPFARHPHWEGP